MAKSTGPKPRALADRFWSKVDRSGGPDACWPWTGGTTGPYGAFNGTTANRVALGLSLGRALTPLEQACHTCDNPPCCNPSHLFPGSVGDNAADRVAKGRQSRDGQHGRATLSDSEVAEIRSRYVPRSGASLAREFGVSTAQVSRIVRYVSRGRSS